MVSLPTVSTLEELVAVVGDQRNLYVRRSSGPDSDRGGRSRDELTGTELPGLSASPLAVEPWWDDSPRLWVACRLYDYRHFEGRRCHARPWILVGRELGWGPDDEPLVPCVRPVAWVAPEVIEEATRLVDGQAAKWGPLDRSG